MSNTQGESCCDCTYGSYSDSRATVAVAEEVQNSFLNEVHLNKVANLRGPNTLVCQSDQHPYRPIVLKFFHRNSMRFLRETRAIGRLRHSNVIEWLNTGPHPDFNMPWLYTNPSMVPNLHLINNLTEEEHEFSYQEQSNIL
ncbi:hypothetical protein PoB_007721900 [Plakobranchus ocellatus]|uniref:Protein kinase domain-containing protein n=1 Tax=Plakobranchus ocellatus TaxID=259542 RepID=A0AAV4E3M6_9GAST|nr:hypothetical protein PoB_007721900 [Plakobranchus ocellatus]